MSTLLADKPRPEVESSSASEVPQFVIGRVERVHYPRGFFDATLRSKGEGPRQVKVFAPCGAYMWKNSDITLLDVEPTDFFYGLCLRRDDRTYSLLKAWFNIVSYDATIVDVPERWKYVLQLQKRSDTIDCYWSYHTIFNNNHGSYSDIGKGSQIHLVGTFRDVSHCIVATRIWYCRKLKAEA